MLLGLGTHSDLQAPVVMAGDFWEAAILGIFVALLLAVAATLVAAAALLSAAAPLATATAAVPAPPALARRRPRGLAPARGLRRRLQLLDCILEKRVAAAAVAEHLQAPGAVAVPEDEQAGKEDVHVGTICAALPHLWQL